MFHRKGQSSISRRRAQDDRILGPLPGADAEELTADDVPDAATMSARRPFPAAEGVRSQWVAFNAQNLVSRPEILIAVPAEARAVRAPRLGETLNDHDDMQSVPSNFEIRDDLLAKLTA